MLKKLVTITALLSVFSANAAFETSNQDTTLESNSIEVILYEREGSLSQLYGNGEISEGTYSELSKIAASDDLTFEMEYRRTYDAESVAALVKQGGNGMVSATSFPTTPSNGDYRSYTHRYDQNGYTYETTTTEKYIVNDNTGGQWVLFGQDTRMIGPAQRPDYRDEP